MCATRCIVVYIVVFCVVLVLVALVVTWRTVVVSITLYCCICFFSCCCSCSCCHYCCRWCAVIVFFLCRRPLFVVRRHLLASILPFLLLSQCIVVSRCFALFHVAVLVVSCCCCPCPCCVRIFLFLCRFVSFVFFRCYTMGVLLTNLRDVVFGETKTESIVD